ncbi:MAG TPA: hypothetical protein DEP61_02880 [Lachnospiraceae bacterium]|nr:hypothetical protein [Lachnospiraceae bacterium]
MHLGYPFYKEKTGQSPEQRGLLFSVSVGSCPAGAPSGRFRRAEGVRTQKRRDGIICTAPSDRRKSETKSNLCRRGR